MKGPDGVELKPEDLLEGDLSLASPPEVYARIRRLVDQPGGTVGRVAELIERDPALTARLLRVANSAFFSLAQPVATIHDAVTLLGWRELKNLVLATEVIQRFESVPPELVDIYSWWHESLRCAVLARLLARGAQPPFDAEGLFIPALLHGIGHLVIYTRIPELGRKALLESRYRERPLHEMQRAVIGFDYAEVGAALAGRWHFPPLVRGVIGGHVAPELSAEFRAESALVQVALSASRAGSFDPVALLAAAGKDQALWRMARIRPEDLVAVAVEAEEAFHGALGLFH